MSNNKISLAILSKRVELLEMRLAELQAIDAKAVDKRFEQIEESLFSTKEMLTATETAQYLGISLSQLYKLTCSSMIPFFKPRGKMVYFEKDELVNWMKKGHVKMARIKPAEKKVVNGI